MDDFTRSIFSEVEKFETGYQPESGFRPGPEILPEGGFAFEIVGVGVDKMGVDHAGTAFLSLTVRVTEGEHAGVILDVNRYLGSQENLNKLGGDLVALGFDADKWTPQNRRPFSSELARLLEQKLLVGVKFRGQRKNGKGQPDRQGNAKTYHNLYINARINSAPHGASNGAPVSPSPAPSLPPARQPFFPASNGQASRPPVTVANDEDGVPF